MADTAKEEALVARIVASSRFSSSPEKRKLLAFLCRKRAKKLTAKDIEFEFYKTSPDGTQSAEVKVRVQCGEIRKALEDYGRDHPEEELICTLPNASENDGYQLKFDEAESKSKSATEAFWQAHSDRQRDVIVVCGSHLFFHDGLTNRAFRYYDFNERLRSNDAILEKFNSAHPEAFQPHLRAWYHSYLSSGEVRAFEMIQKWFFNHSNVLLSRTSSRETPEDLVLRTSPILLGRPDTNKFIQSAMEAPEASGLGYRIPATLGAIAITDIRENEKQALAGFPLTSEGILGPVPTSERVFGLVSRCRNLSGHGHVTIISADSHARAVSQIANVLTDDLFALELFNKTGWLNERRMPETFEMLFSVTITPGGLDGEGHPQLLCWRP